MVLRRSSISLTVCLLTVSSSSPLPGQQDDSNNDFLDEVVPDRIINNDNRIGREEDTYYGRSADKAGDIWKKVQKIADGRYHIENEVKDDNEYYTDNEEWRERPEKRSFDTFLAQRQRNNWMLMNAMKTNLVKKLKAFKRVGGVKHLLALCKRSERNKNTGNQMQTKLRDRLIIVNL